MNAPRPVAFYAPLKSPDHRSPSGDRTMARLLMKALERAGFAPVLASGSRSLDKAGHPEVQARIRQDALAEAGSAQPAARSGTAPNDYSVTLPMETFRGER